MVFFFTLSLAIVGAADVPTFFEDAWIKQRAKHIDRPYPAGLPAWLFKATPNPGELTGWNDQWAGLTREFAVPLRVGVYLAQIGATRAAELEVRPVLRALGRINAAIRDVPDPRVAAALLDFVLVHTVRTVRADLGPLDADAAARVNDLLECVRARAERDRALARADRAWGHDARVDAIFQTLRGAAGAGLILTVTSHVFLGAVYPWDSIAAVAGALGVLAFGRTKAPASAQSSNERRVVAPLAAACQTGLLTAATVED